MLLSAKIVRNTAANYGGGAIFLVVGFLLTPYLVHTLGDSKYGAWVLVGSLSSYFWLLDFGLGASVIKFVSELGAADERERLNAVITSSFALLTVIGALSAAGCLVLGLFVDQLFSIPADSVYDVQVMIYITVVSLFLSFPLSVFGGVLRGYQRYDLVNAVGIVSTTVNAILSFLALSSGTGLIGLAVVGLITNLLVGVARMEMAKRVDRGLVVHPRLLSMDILREITGFSFWVFVINIAVQVVYRSGPVMIGALLSVALITPYAIANGLIQYVRRAVDPILTVLLPAYAELGATDDTAGVRNLFLEGSKVVGAVAAPMVLGLILLGRQFIARWMGPAYEDSYALLVILTVPLFISFLVATGDKLLWAKGKIRVNSYVAVADTLITLVFGIVLTARLGVIGVPIATLVSVTLTNGFWLLPYICREAKVTLAVYMRNVIQPVALPTIPATALVLIGTQLLGASTYLHMMVLGTLCMVGYWGTFLLVSRPEERLRWIAVVRSAFVPERPSSLERVA